MKTDYSPLFVKAGRVQPQRHEDTNAQNEFILSLGD